jgi:hypothetical protein
MKIIGVKVIVDIVLDMIETVVCLVVVGTDKTSVEVLLEVLLLGTKTIRLRIMVLTLLGIGVAFLLGIEVVTLPRVEVVIMNGVEIAILLRIGVAIHRDLEKCLERQRTFFYVQIHLTIAVTAIVRGKYVMYVAERDIIKKYVQT